MRMSLKGLALLTGFIFLPASSFADTITAKTKLLRGNIISASDLVTGDDTARAELSNYVGKEVVRTIYPGRAISARDISEPILVRRNSRVKMIYKLGRLQINTGGRAMGQGAAGDMISVMNLDSRKRVEGRILANGDVEVRP